MADAGLSVIKSLFALLKPSPKFNAALALLYLAYLIVPGDSEVKVSLRAVLKEFVFIVHVVGAFSISYLLIELVVWLWEKWKFRKKINHGKKYLRSLTEEEKQILKSYISEGTRTATFEISDGRVAQLEALWILVRPTTVSIGGTEFHYNIQPWAFDYLVSNKNLLD